MKIKKGKHGNIHFPRLIRKAITKTVMFTDSCRYDIGDDQSDINKLLGIGYFPYHRMNSARLGWRYIRENDSIELLMYWYKNKARYNESLCQIKINQRYVCSLTTNESSHIFSVKTMDNELLSIKSIDLKPRFIGYELFPYFGGNIKAPHDIIIDIS
jgi:hypothetical protein